MAVLVILAIIGAKAGDSTENARKEGLWPPEGTKPTDEDVLKLVQAGNKIMAIKMYREIHGVGLATAKEFVDELATRVGPNS